MDSKPKNPHAVALGSARSPKKAISSKLNGQLGGRPRVKTITTRFAHMIKPDHAKTAEYRDHLKLMRAQQVQELQAQALALQAQALAIQAKSPTIS